MNYNNLAQRTNFIASSDKFKNLPFFLTSVNIPGINLSHPEVGGAHSSRLKLSSDTVTFNSLTFTMLVDEDFHIYRELMDIIRENIDIDTGTYKDLFFDFFIELQNNKGNKIFKLDFYNCRIESIGDIFLDSQDETTHYTLDMTMVYDYYEIDQRRVMQIIGGTAAPVNQPDEYPQLEFSEQFDEISEDWQLWGFPTPILSNDAGAINGKGLDSNGGGLLESGAVLNSIEIDVTKNFEVIFRVKQPLGADTSNGTYLDFGITEGAGISSTSNGRTGSTLMGVVVDGGSKDDTSIKSTTYSIKGSLDEIKPDFDNDGQFHEYKFKYVVNGQNAEYQIYKNDTIQMSAVGNISNHDFVYIYVQGKSEGSIQIVDTISATYGEVV